MGKLKIWAPEEDQILIKVSQMIKSKKWKKASEELRKSGFERTDVECRERFINHLDPTVNKELWTDQELEILYAKYDQYGNKWFLLQKHLPGRTQTKIKNYFYGNIRYLLKIIVKYFFKKSTGFINDIKTETLLDMYQAKNVYEDDFLIHKTIKRLNFKIEKKFSEKIIKQNEEEFYGFTQKFLSSQKEGIVEQNNSEEDYQERSAQQMVKIECLPVIIPTKVEIICSVAGQVHDRTGELQYLKSMAANHMKLYEFYNTNYLTLLNRVQEKSTTH